MPANAIPIFGTGTWGSFTGTFEYAYTSPTAATLSVSLTNTSPAVNGGYITAFAFNNPFEYITSANLTTYPSSWQLLFGSINASPFGDFDVGSAIGASWLGSGPGGGNPNDGIGVGSTGSFVFALTGSNFNILTTQSFFPVGEDENFVVRFRGFNNEASDKVPGDPGNGFPLPEPGTMILLGLGLLGLGIVVRKRS